MNELDYTVVPTGGADLRRVVVLLKGDLDRRTAPRLRAGLLPLADDGGDLVLDLGELAFLDSSGLSVFIVLHKRATARGGRLLLDRVPAFAERVLAVTGLGRVFGAS